MRRRLPLVVVLAGAAVLRLVVLTSTAARLDGDEAVTGIMARRILDGHHLAFFAGQSYMGTGEQYLQAITLGFLPDSDLTLRLPQVALAVAACACVAAIAARSGLSRRRAVLAAALFAVGPYFAVLWSVKSRGAYDLALLAALGGVLVALSTPPGAPRLAARVGVFGLLCGVGLWSNLQAAYLLLPAGWWLLAAVRGPWRRALAAVAAAVAGFAIGFLPSLWHVLAGGSLEVAGRHPDSSVAQRADALVGALVPDFLGASDGGRARLAWIPPAFVVLVAVAALGAAVSRRRSGIGAVLRLRREGRTGLDLLLLAIVVSPLLFVQSQAGGGDVRNPSYLFVLYGALPVLLAAVPVPRLLAGRRVLTDGLAAVAVLVLLLHTVTGVRRDERVDFGGDITRSGQRVRSEELDAVVDSLVAAGARTAYADYFLAQVLEWRAGDRLVVETIYSKRFPHATRAAGRDPSPALVVASREADDVADALRRRDATFDQQEVEGWVLFTDVSPGQHPREALTMAEGLG